MGASFLVLSLLTIVYLNLTVDGSTNESPPSLILHVRVPTGERELALVGYALQLVCLSTMAVLDGGREKSSPSCKLLSPEAAMRDSNADICLS